MSYSLSTDWRPTGFTWRPSSLAANLPALFARDKKGRLRRPARRRRRPAVRLPCGFQLQRMPQAKRQHSAAFLPGQVNKHTACFRRRNSMRINQAATKLAAGPKEAGKISRLTWPAE